MLATPLACCVSSGKPFSLPLPPLRNGNSAGALDQLISQVSPKVLLSIC